MGLRLKVCADCGKRKWIGNSKRRCKACRVIDPDKYVRTPPKPRPPRRPKPSKTALTPRASVGPFKDWPVTLIPKCVQPQNDQHSHTNLGTRQRNYVLKVYGFANYNAYLQSELWASIRTCVLKGGTLCVCGCGQVATQVHHRAYTEANLMGTSLHGLVAIHHDCHYAIEFSGARKTSLEEANRELKNRKSCRAVFT